MKVITTEQADPVIEENSHDDSTQEVESEEIQNKPRNDFSEKMAKKPRKLTFDQETTSDKLDKPSKTGNKTGFFNVFGSAQFRLLRIFDQEIKKISIFDTLLFVQVYFYRGAWQSHFLGKNSKTCILEA